MVSFETIRFPIIFGTFLFSSGLAYVFRENLIPDLENEKKELFRGNEEDRDTLLNAIKARNK